MKKCCLVKKNGVSSYDDYVETSLCLSKEFSCFEKYINIQTFYFISCGILKARELCRASAVNLLDALRYMSSPQVSQ